MQFVAAAVCSFFAIGGSALAACPNEAIREQQNVTYLPACRAYEQVSQVNKAGYDVSSFLKGNLALDAAIAPDGGAISYVTANPLPPANGGTEQAYLAKRSTNGWLISSLSPVPGPNTVGFGLPQLDNWWRGATTDLQQWVYFDVTTSPLPSLWAVRSDGTRKKIVDGAALDFQDASQASPGYENQSADGRHVVFADEKQLVPIPGEPETSGRDLLYEWVDDGLNEGAGTLRLVNVADDGTLIGESSARLGSTPNAPRSQSFVAGSRHAVSADGSRIYFQSPPESGPVYLREDGLRTIEVSAPQDGNPAATGSRYLDASLDGGVVFFWADAPLTAAADPGGGVYRYEVEGERLSWLGASPGVPTAMASADGARLYYGTSGVQGLFLAEGDGPAREVANLIPSRLEDTFCPTANISGDGRYLVMLTGSEGIWRYDAAADAVSKVAAPGSGTELRGERGCSTSTITPRLYGRVMSNDGRVFFETEASLVQRDSNGLPDVYEWDQGNVDLLSSGTGSESSFLIGVDASGTDAFIATRDRLLPSDGDALQDVYAVRVGGGFPFDVSAPCRGESCQGAGAVAPAAAAAGSALVGGAGNAVPRRQKKQQGCAPSSHKSKGKGKARRLTSCSKKKSKKGKSRVSHRQTGHTNASSARKVG